jgi:hypothetical protein
VAHEVQVHGAAVKVRRPAGVFFLSLITLGVYFAVWYYRTNRELRDFGAAYGDRELAESKPVVSLVAMTVGLIVLIPAIASLWNFVGRVRRAEQIGGGRLTSGWLVAILVITFFLLVAIPGYVQSDMNALWARYAPDAPPERDSRWTRIGAWFRRRWAWLMRGEPRALRPPPAWIFQLWVGWVYFAAAIGLAFTPVWPLSLVLILVFALQVYEDCRARGFSSFWWPTFAVNLGPPVFLAYVANRSENSKQKSGQGPPTPAEFQVTGHLPPAGWYPDPLGENATRWWDGQRWTQDLRR